MRGYETIVSLKKRYSLPAGTTDTELLVAICRCIAEERLAESDSQRRRPMAEVCLEISAEIRLKYGLTAYSHPDDVIAKMVAVGLPVDDVLDRPLSTPNHDAKAQYRNEENVLVGA